MIIERINVTVGTVTVKNNNTFALPLERQQ
jgi:hypothetical protein